MGLHSAEEIEQLIISHKRKHNENAPHPPTVLTVLPLLYSIHTHVEQHKGSPTLPKQLKVAAMVVSFWQKLKLQFILPSSNHPIFDKEPGEKP